MWTLDDGCVHSPDCGVSEAWEGVPANVVAEDESRSR
jgi:hypothetical protein